MKTKVCHVFLNTYLKNLHYGFSLRVSIERFQKKNKTAFSLFVYRQEIKCDLSEPILEAGYIKN